MGGEGLAVNDASSAMIAKSVWDFFSIFSRENSQSSACMHGLFLSVCTYSILRISLIMSNGYYFRCRDARLMRQMTGFGSPRPPCHCCFL